MALICSISNEVPEQPVISPVSNHIYERRLIEKYLEDNHTDPMNGEPLDPADLIEIKTHPLIRPRPPTATSIPAILKLLQDEWDGCMLQTFTLRQHLHTTRQELSHVLYQHDAACRVIARLTRETNELREKMANMKPISIGPPQGVGVSLETRETVLAPSGAPMDTGEEPPAAGTALPPLLQPESNYGGITEDVKQRLQETSSYLTAERKKRGKKPPEALASPDDILAYEQLESHSGLHSAGTPGILCFDMSHDYSRVLTGGIDKAATLFDRSSEQIVASLKGHSQPVNHVVLHSRKSRAFTASADSTLRMWETPSGQCMRIVKPHDSDLTALSLHATGDYLLTCSTDRHWSFIDIETGTIMAKVGSDSSSSGLSCGQFHPDGHIFGTGTRDSIIRIWDLEDQNNVANFEGHQGSITSLAFSENGYYLASAADDSLVKIWDLRKLKNIKTITLDEEFEVRGLSFDQSGQYLALAGSDIQVYLVRQWSLLRSFKEHNAVATAVIFGPDSKFLSSVSMDRTLRFFGPSQSSHAEETS